jgi:Bacterial lectin
VRNRILFISAVSCLAIALATPPAVADIVPLSSLNLVGNSPGTSQLVVNQQNQTVLRLTPNFDTNPSGAPPAGAAWTQTPYDVADPFSVNFHFQMSDPCLKPLPDCANSNGNGGDGIAFLIQNSSAGKNAIGEGAGGMGFLGITDSVAIMLDTYQNDSKNFYGDPSNNYISVNTRGTLFNAPHHFCTNGILATPDSGGSDLANSSFSDTCLVSPTLGMATIDPNFDNMDKGVHDLAITYMPGPGTLNIFLDSNEVLTINNFNFVDTLGLPDGKAYLGFTAGTRFAYQNQDILDFTIAPEPVWGQLWVPLAMILAAVLTRRWQRGRS